MCNTRRSNGPDRGNATARRARKQFLLDKFGNGVTVECALGCGAVLTKETLTVDRIIPGSLGGSYRRDNVQPACDYCNKSRKDKPLNV